MRNPAEFYSAVEARLQTHRDALHSAANRIEQLCQSSLEIALGKALILEGHLFGPPVVVPYQKGAPVGHGYYIVPQFRILTYRSDFAVFLRSGGVGVRLLVEADGAYWHSRTGEQELRDYGRDDKLFRTGWPVCRFTESQIKEDPYDCADAVWQRLYAAWRYRSQSPRTFAESAA